MPQIAKAQVYETVTTTEDFEYVTGIPENGLPTVMPNDWDRISNFPQHNFLSGVTNNLFGSDPNNILNLIGDKYLFLGSSGAGPLNLLILPHYYRASHISFLAWTDEVENMYNVEQDFHSDQGYLQMGYITNINDASTFVPLQTEIRPMVGSKIDELSQATYSYSLSNIPDNARLAFKWINEIQSDPSDVSFTLIDNVTVAHDVPKTHIANTATSTAMTWAQFAQNVSSGINYEGQTVYLDSDVTATTMVGTNENNCFKGTFEGNNHTLTFNYTATEQYTAPFRYLNGATIRNLKVNGTITTSVDRCAGLAGHCFGNNTITNCLSNITINSSKSGDGSHGGLVSIVRTGSTTFEGCTFTGQLLGSSTNRCGGLAGCTVTSAVFNNCVFDPTEITIKRDNSASFSRKFDDNAVVTVDNCYYTYDFNDGTNYVGQGKQRYTITGQNPVSIVINGTATNHNMSHITAYSGTPGLLYNGTIIAGEGDQVRLNLNGGDTYFAIHGTLTGSYNPHTLTMEASNTVIGVNRTHIANTSTSTTMTWDEFAYNVNNGITYSGMTVYLDEDITATTMAGTNENYCFKGTFEGQGHTLTFNYTATAWYTAPFSYLNGATIRNLKVDGTITANSARCSGLAGHCYGNTTITNCWSDITINSSLTSAGFYGGFVSVVRTGTTTLEGCTFTGRFLGSTHRCGGLVGSTVTVVVFNNCVFDPTEITIGLENCASFSTKYDDDNSVVTVNNSYYTSAFNDGTNYVNQGKQRYTITAVSPVTVAMNGTATNYDASHITAYSDNPGLLYNGTIIAGEGEQVSLNLNGGGNSYLIDHGILTGDSNPRTLTMEAYNTVIGLNKTHIANSSTSTAMTWDEFAQYVNNGMTYYGTTLYLDEDITATTMAGTNETNCFQGTFDGQGHTLTFNYTATAWYTAPFSYLNGATIRNLKVDGTITANSARCGGLAGHCYGDNTIINCLSDITINSSLNSDGTYGGFVSVVRTGTTTFEGCAFTGRLLGSGTYKSGGLVGSTVTAVVFNNCVFAPTEVTIGLNGSATFSRKFYPDSSVISINNSYYTYDFNDGTTHVGQGKQRYTITGQSPVSVAMNGTATNYNVSHITTYSDNPGLLYNGTIFAGSGEQVSLNLSGGDDDAYITDHGTLTGTTNPYTLTMWADNTVIMKAPEEFQVIGEQSAYTAYNIFPGYNGYCYKVFIYRPEDAEFLNYDFDISSIAFDVTQSRTSIAELALWVKDVDADYIMYGYQNFAYFIDGATQVYDTQTAFDLTTGWHTFAFNSTVPHEGGKALLVAMRGVSSNVAGNTTSSSNNVRITSKQRASWSLGANNTDPGYNSNTGAQSELRANIRLGIDYTGATCFSPTNLFVTYPDCVDTEVNLGWTENSEATTWEICLNGDENNLITANSNPFTLTGLTPNATYTTKVRAVCGDDLRSQWSESVSFEPTIKTVVGIYETGAPQLPTTINSIYSLSQQIYTPAELGDAGTIISIDFFNGESGEATRNLEIYMKHTDWEDFNTWNHVEPTDLVFSGTVSFASQAWTTITLDTPFAYDGEQNVVITVDDNTGSATSGFYHFLCFYTTDQSYQSIAYYGDENYDPTFTYSQGYTTRGKYKNQIRLVKVLKAPEMTVSYANGNTTLNWTDSSASGWQICIDGDENNLITVTENTYTMTNFTPSADHTFKVRAFCGTSNYGEWSQEASFRPSNFTVTDITTNGATLHWDSYTTTSAWQVSLVNKYSAYNLYTPEIIDVDSNPFTLTDLEGPMSYYVKVRNCYGPNDYSEWSDEVEFSTYMDFPYFTDFDSVYINRSDYEYGLSQGITLEQLIELRKNCSDCVRPFWYRHSDGGAVGWVRFKYDSNFANSGDGFMQFNVPKEMGQFGHTGYYYAFMSTVAPDMDISSLGVEFMAKKDRDSESVSTFTVGVMEDDYTFVPIKTFNPTEYSKYVRHTFTLHPYTGNGKYIAFRTSYVDGKDNIAYIDDVLVKDCHAISEFPWSEDFEGYPADRSADLHWSYLNGRGNYYFINGCWENEVVSGTSMQFEVSRYNLYNNWTNKLNIAFRKAGTTKFMTPLMDLPDNNYEFMFDVYRDWESGYANDRIKVYASANGEITGATLLATINHHYSVGDGHHIPAESEAGWYHYALPIGMEGPCYIILVAESQSTDNTLRMFLDNFMVREIANCPEPADLTVSNLTINTVQLGWTAGSGQTAWQVCVDGDEDHLIDVTGNSYTITGLSAASSHSAKVRALCSAGGYSYWSDEVFFTTHMAPVDLPYITDFEDGCDWRFVNGDCDAQWTWGTAGYVYGASAGNHSVYISNDGGNTAGYNPDLPSLVFATKTFNFTGAPHYFISYMVDYRYYYATVQYYGWYYTRVALVPEALAATLTANVFPEGFSRTSLPEGWIALDGGEGIWRTSSKSMEIDIDDGTYVMVFAFRNTYDSQGIRNPPAIDNISIEPVNSLKPTDLHLEALTTTTATLGWTENSGNTSWQICLNDDETNLIETNDNPFTLTGLNPATSYFVKVRSLHNGTQSFWSDYIGFATPQEAVDLPYSTDFETSCDWNFVNININSWIWGDDAHNGAGEHSIYISDDGIHNEYNNTLCPALAFATKTFNFETGNYHIAFDWRADAESTYDYLRAALVPDSVLLQAGTTALPGLTYNTLPEGWMALDGGSQLCGVTEWQTLQTDFSISQAGEYMIVFVWRNDSYTGNNPPAAIDNVSITPSICEQPTNLICTATTVTSATLSWTENGEATAWQICINGNENNLIEVTEKQYTLTGLTTMTSYTAKVRVRTGAELCEWSNEIVINTAQEPVSLPYSTDFETASDWYLINGDLTNAWVWGEAAHHGEGTHGLYISNDGGTSHSYDNTSAATVYAVKAFNFESGIYKFTFDWIAYGKNDSWGDAMNVFLVPADQNLVAEPWGTIGAGGWIYVGPYGLYYGSTEWQTAINEVPISSGTYYLAFIWQNDSRYGDNPPAAIDNLSIALCECPKPVNLYFNVAEQTNTAELSWTEMGEATQWQICLDGDEDNLIDVSTNPYSLTGLAFESWHSVKVRANCGESQSDWSSTVNFEVTQKIHIGKPIVYHHSLPFDNLYNYSLTQQLYMSEELGYAGLITSIDFRKDTDKECVRNLDIYMVHTDKISFESTTDWIQVTDADLVFSGTVNFVHNDWTTITLDTPFNYDGQHNVALIVDDNTGSYGETTNFLCTYDLHSNYDRAMFYYNDNTNYDPKGTPGAAEGRTNRKCQIRIMKVVNFTEEIAGYGTGNGKWHLVASPLAAATYPTDVVNMITNTYDLYRFNPLHNDNEWENFKDGSFFLEAGKGYLYAHSTDATLSFFGTPYSGNGEFALSYDANDEHKCWNLVGNPFTSEATLNREYYVMKTDGTGINPVAIPATTPIPPCTAVFVKATAAGQTVVFTRVTP